MTNLGCLDYALRDRIGQSLAPAGFAVQVANEEINGNDATNICNRGARGVGVQLETSAPLSGKLSSSTAACRAPIART